MRQKLYELMDAFLVEAQDQDGNYRSVKQLNQDRHLFIANLTQEIEKERQQLIKEIEKRIAYLEKLIGIEFINTNEIHNHKTRRKNNTSHQADKKRCNG